MKYDKTQGNKKTRWTIKAPTESTEGAPTESTEGQLGDLLVN